MDPICIYASSFNADYLLMGELWDNLQPVSSEDFGQASSGGESLSLSQIPDPQLDAGISITNDCQRESIKAAPKKRPRVKKDIGAKTGFSAPRVDKTKLYIVEATSSSSTSLSSSSTVELLAVPAFNYIRKKQAMAKPRTSNGSFSTRGKYVHYK